MIAQIYRAPIVARLLLIAVLGAFFTFAGCARLAEPPQDLRLIAGLEALAIETETLAADTIARPGADRRTAYATIEEHVATLTALTEARAAAMAVSPEPGAYGNATAGFLADYARNLDLLAARDAASGSYGVLPQFVALRLAAMRDALSDALTYERTVLDRTH